MRLSVLASILAFTTLGGIASAAVAGAVLLLPAATRIRFLPHLVSFATGALLGAALLGLLPEAIERAGPGRGAIVGLAVTAGILLFFSLEKLMLWRHSHGGELHDQETLQHSRDQASAMVVLLGDGMHNALDGVLIAAAFMTSVELGMATGIAVIVHEIPQEVGSFAVLLNAGMSRARALLLNLFSSLTSILGGTIAYYALGAALGALPYAVAVAAASLLYVAMADLIPGLHRRAEVAASVAQVLLISLGIGLIAWVGRD
jgi:zinc and cadmium transporter